MFTRNKYSIKFPDQLIPGDVIISTKTQSFIKVSFIDQGRGAGHLDFGEYVIITGSSIREGRREDFWSFENQPLIVLEKP